MTPSRTLWNPTPWANLRRTGIPRIALLGLLWGSLSAPALASERIVMKYRIFERSLSVADLTTFAETGDTSRPLKRYLRVSGQDPDKVRRALTQTVPISVTTADRVLNSFVGDFFLGQMSQYIYTSSRQEDNAAMRSAIILAASDDNNVSVLEILQKYPTTDVYLDGDRLIEAAQQLVTLQNQLDRLLQTIKGR